MPHLTYCLLVWGTTTKQNTQKPLIAQTKAIRHIANVLWCAHTDEYFKKFNIIKTCLLYEYRHIKPPFYQTILPSPKCSCFASMYRPITQSTQKYGSFQHAKLHTALSHCHSMFQVFLISIV